MNPLKKITLLLLLACGAVFLGTSCKEDAELKLNFKPGDKFLYSTQVNQKINGNMDQSMLMEMVYSYSGEDAGSKKLSITYDHIRINTSSPMGESVYDSREAKSGDDAFMNNLIGKSFSVAVAPNGDILKVEGLAELVQALGANTDKETRAQIESQFSDTAIRLMMQNSFDLYPGKKVKAGESWGKKSVMGFSGINVNVENTYTLKSISNGSATVEVTSVMNLPRMNTMGQGGAPMQIEMQGKQDGSMEIELSTGRIISGKTNQKISGKVVVMATQMVNGKEEAMPQEMPMEIEGDIVISSKKM